MPDINKDSMKKAFESIFDSLMSDEVETFGEMIKNFKARECINDPEDFDMEVMYPIRASLGHIFKEDYSTRQYEVAGIYSDYHFYESNLQMIIRKEEGHSCITDKSRWLIRSYLKYLKTGELPVMGEEYWKPKFGTAENWMEFITALTKLKLGHPEFYLQSMLKIVKHST